MFKVHRSQADRPGFWQASVPAQQAQALLTRPRPLAPLPKVCATRKSQSGSLGSHDHSEEDHTFQLSYDILMCSVSCA